MNTFIRICFFILLITIETHAQLIPDDLDLNKQWVFILDFYCPEIKLAIELDGPSHFTEGTQFYDRKRQDYIESFGITFLRFTDTDVICNIDGVIQTIFNKTKELTTPESPSC